MVFSSAIFLFVFLPILLTLYWLSPNGIRNWVLLVGSLLFYSWGEPVFLFAVLGGSAVDFFIAKQLPIWNGKAKKWGLAASLLLNVGLLLYFKYANFFVGNLQAVYAHFGLQPFDWAEVALPVGISFITFQKISYMVDVYRGTVEPQRKFSNLLLYILMFPQLIAGPIVRYKDVERQLTHRLEHDTYARRVQGFARFAVGLAKKVLIANVLAEYADAVFAVSPDYFSSGTAWMGILAYTLQIYFDFSGYSDMALGLGWMFGFRLPENFNFPYISQSITEFWRRWHITLGAWIKDYLYIPLGGNRVPVLRMYFNLCVAFLISGFWHGAAWTFIFWGAYHGVFLIIDKLGMLKLLQKIGKIPSVMLTFLVAMTGWIFFRAESMAYGFAFLRKMFAFDPRIDEFYCEPRFLCVLLIALLGAFAGAFPRIEKMANNLYEENCGNARLWSALALAAALYLLCGGAILAGGLNPFIYFRF